MKHRGFAKSASLALQEACHGITRRASLKVFGMFLDVTPCTESCQTNDELMSWYQQHCLSFKKTKVLNSDWSPPTKVQSTITETWNSRVSDQDTERLLKKKMHKNNVSGSLNKNINKIIDIKSINLQACLDRIKGKNRKELKLKKTELVTHTQENQKYLPFWSTLKHTEGGGVYSLSNRIVENLDKS